MAGCHAWKHIYIYHEYIYIYKYNMFDYVCMLTRAHNIPIELLIYRHVQNYAHVYYVENVHVEMYAHPHVTICHPTRGACSAHSWI